MTPAGKVNSKTIIQVLVIWGFVPGSYGAELHPRLINASISIEVRQDKVALFHQLEREVLMLKKTNVILMPISQEHGREVN